MCLALNHSPLLAYASIQIFQTHQKSTKIVAVFHKVIFDVPQDHFGSNMPGSKLYKTCRATNSNEDINHK